MNTSNIFFLVVGILGPFAVWAIVYAAAKQNAFTLDSMFRVLRVLRWVTWISAGLLWESCFPPLHFHWFYGASVSTFSVGLSFPESWFKQRRLPTYRNADILVAVRSARNPRNSRITVNLDITIFGAISGLRNVASRRFLERL
jgi:hypothetical protein